jgi:basic amino acid/polyamine antiporter, APA family
MSFLTRRKPIDSIGNEDEGRRLTPSLSWWHLVMLGVGAIVGTGIYTLTGVGVDRAGPGIIVAFAIVGVICACVALAYAELATMMPGSGGAYTYSYAVLGELLAWIIGWSLVLEYSLVVSAVAVGWSGYAVGFLNGIGFELPAAIAAGPHAGGLVNLPAVFIIFVIAGLLILGTRESANVNAILVAIKVAALVLFVAVALPHFDAANFQPLMPYGFNKQDLTLPGETEAVARGVMAGAAIVFFAFYGFDAVSTAAEEAKRPGRDLTLGIVGSMVICTILYMLVAAAAVGSAPFRQFAGSAEPLAHILRLVGQPLPAQIVAAAVVIGVPTVILAFLYGQTRIFFVMARDGLLPEALSRINRAGTPVMVTIFTAIIVAALAGVLRLDEIAALANAGTLAAFVAVGVCLLVLRVRDPNRLRVFRTPLAWVVGPVAILGCLYLFYSLPDRTKVYFLIAHVVGLLLYFGYGVRRSRLSR